MHANQRGYIKHVSLYIIPCEGAYLRHWGMKMYAAREQENLLAALGLTTFDGCQSGRE